MSRVISTVVLAAIFAASACSFDGRGVTADGSFATPPDAARPGPVADAAPMQVADGSPVMPDAAPPPPWFFAHFVYTSPSIDGIWDEQWNVAKQSQGFDFITAEYKWPIHVDYAFDGAVQFYVVHDANFLYLFATVTDTNLVIDGSDFYDDDGIWLFVDGSGDMTGHYHSDDVLLYSRYDGQFQAFGDGDTSKVWVGSQVTENGYDLEIRVPIIPGGNAVGFNLVLADDDGMGALYPDAIGQWKYNQGTCDDCCGRNDDVSWCDTSSLVRLALEQAPQ